MLAELQAGVEDIERARGTLDESVEQKLLILAEESFEVLKTLRAKSGAATDFYWNRSASGNELLDVLFVTAAIANRLQISLKESVKALQASVRWDRKAVSGAAGRPALEAGLRLADCVLTFMRAYSQTSTAPHLSEQGSSCPDFSLIGRELAGVTLTVLELALSEHIDIAPLVRRTLSYDQLRLWAHGESEG